MSFSLLDLFEILSVDDDDNNGVSCRPTKFTVGRGPSDNNDKGKKPVDLCYYLSKCPKRSQDQRIESKVYLDDEVELRAHNS